MIAIFLHNQKADGAISGGVHRLDGLQRKYKLPKHRRDEISNALLGTTAGPSARLFLKSKLLIQIQLVE